METHVTESIPLRPALGVARVEVIIAYSFGITLYDMFKGRPAKRWDFGDVGW